MGTGKVQVWRMLVRSMHDTSFAELFRKSNSSFSPVRGKAVECTVRPLPQNMVSVDTGLKAPIVCFQHEMGTTVTEKMKVAFGVENVESFREPVMLLPKQLQKKNRALLAWEELEKTSKERGVVKGFFMNKVNGGYAVAIAGHVAFVPRTLMRQRRIYPHNPWRMFNILSMNKKLGNIVVKEAFNRMDTLNPTARRPWLSGGDGSRGLGSTFGGGTGLSRGQTSPNMRPVRRLRTPLPDTFTKSPVARFFDQ